MPDQWSTQPAAQTYGQGTEGDEVDYPDVDMQVRLIDGQEVLVRRSDGTPY